MRSSTYLLSLTALLTLCLQTALAVIVPGGRDTSGVLDNSGTNKNPAPFNLGSYTGRYGPFLGTVIAPNYMITATHLGDQGQFTYADGSGIDQNYNTTLVGSLNDLSIYKLTQLGGGQANAQLSHYIPIYTGTISSGQSLVVIGNGTDRGAPVFTPSTSNLAGWEWGAGSYIRSWGTNTVDSVVTLTDKPGAPFQGNFIYFTLDGSMVAGAPTHPDSAILSGGDSGGPTFVLDPSDNQWKLGGVNSLVEGVSKIPNGDFYPAALFNAQGFYDGPDLIVDSFPLGSLVTDISSRQDFINSIIAVPEPGTLALVGLLAFSMPAGYLFMRKYRRQRFDAELIDVQDS